MEEDGWVLRGTGLQCLHSEFLEGHAIPTYFQIQFLERSLQKGYQLLYQEKTNTKTHIPNKMMIGVFC